MTALLISANRRHPVHHSGIRITGLPGRGRVRLKPDTTYEGYVVSGFSQTVRSAKSG